MEVCPAEAQRRGDWKIQKAKGMKNGISLQKPIFKRFSLRLCTSEGNLFDGVFLFSDDRTRCPVRLDQFIQ
jgi:hypothetical protein